MDRTFARLFTLLCCASVLLVSTTHAESGDSGDATEGGLSAHVIAAPQSAVSRVDMFFFKENGKTTIAQRVCGNGAHFQLRSENIGKWSTEVFYRTEVANGCSPSTTSWWKMVINADPGPDQFRIYATNNETRLSDNAFMERAVRHLCRVTAYGVGTCTRETVTVPRNDVNEPSDGQTVQGTINVRGWAADIASLDGSGVNEVHVYAGDTFLGIADYGQALDGIASAFGDSRFTNSGYNYSLDTTRLPNGATTIRVAAKSTLTGQWSWFERRVVVNNQTAPPQPPPSPTRNILDVRYVDQVYVQQRPQCFGKDCYWNHCGPSSVAMVLHYEGKEPRDVFTDRQATLDLVNQVKRPGQGAADVGLMLLALKNKKLQATTRYNPDFAAVKQSIQAGHPIVAGIREAGHVITVVGYNDDGTIVVNDPYGGFEWWKNGNQKNVPYRGNPYTKGQKVTYRLGVNLHLTYGIFISGPAPLRAAAAASIGANGGIVNGDGASITFQPRTSVQSLLTTDALTVTYTPDISPTQTLDSNLGMVTIFRLGATDVNGQAVSRYPSSFNMVLSLDPSLVNSLNTSDGQTDQTDEEGNPVDQPTTNTSQAILKLVLKAWNVEHQRWEVVPSILNTTTGELMAQDDRFTEFAVVVQQEYQTFLPTMIR